MVLGGGGLFLMSEVAMYDDICNCYSGEYLALAIESLQRYLAHKKTHPPKTLP